MGKAELLPCRCGAVPSLCYHDYVTAFNGTYGASVYETTRYFRYICPNCHEWGRAHEYPRVAKRFWNGQASGKTKPYWHNADMEKARFEWRDLKTDEVMIR